MSRCPVCIYQLSGNVVYKNSVPYNILSAHMFIKGARTAKMSQATCMCSSSLHGLSSYFFKITANYYCMSMKAVQSLLQSKHSSDASRWEDNVTWYYRQIEDVDLTLWAGLWHLNNSHRQCSKWDSGSDNPRSLSGWWWWWWWDLVLSPGAEDIQAAACIEQFNNGRPLRMYLISAELLKLGDEIVLQWQTQLAGSIWQSEKAPEDWVNQLTVHCTRKPLNSPLHTELYV